MPFCFHKCHYCDFYSIVDRHDRQDRFVDRLLAEIDSFAARTDSPLETVFVGGGTPTLLEPALWERLLSTMADRLTRAAGLEFTVESNPETVSEPLARILSAGGVSRVSVGCQTFDPRHLKTLERWHDPASVATAVAEYRAAGLEDVNLDLIFGIPGQTLAEWEDDLDRALDLEPTHLSCYGLMYEPNTPLRTRLETGEVEPIDEALEAAMYELACDRLADAGFDHYEISAWARPGRRCRHNLLYWDNGDWWPLGPAAAGHVQGVRWRNAPRLEAYLGSGAEDPWPPIVDIELPDPDRARRERLMLGLRRLDGIPHDQLATLGPEPAALDRHLRDGLLERTDTAVRLTRRGLLLADGVICDLL